VDRNRSWLADPTNGYGQPSRTARRKLSILASHSAQASGELVARFLRFRVCGALGGFPISQFLLTLTGVLLDQQRGVFNLSRDVVELLVSGIDLLRSALRPAMMLFIAGAGYFAEVVGWWKQDWLREQYQWRMVMGPTVLTPEREHALPGRPGVPRMRARLPDNGRGPGWQPHDGFARR
jgi:hypothetical protein